MEPSRTFVKEQQLPSFFRPFTLCMRDRLSVRLYSDSRPNCLEIAPLQKGLVLIFDGEELIEEGVGFGVPVVKYNDKTYFSSSAECSIEENGNLCILVKSFVLDTVSRKRVWKTSYIDDQFYSFVHKLFERAYLGHKNLAPFFNRIMELRRIIKVQTEFTKVKPRGTITFKYSFQSSIIKINVNFSNLDLAKCQEILILDEQGSTFFRKYFDTDGLRLFDEGIGAWEVVKAKEASLSDAKEALTFTLRNKEPSVLFRGWEKTKGRFSWAGLNYSLHPGLHTFDYVIKLTIKTKAV